MIKRVENDGAQDGAGRAVQVHDVQRRDRRERRHQHRGNDGEIFRDVVGDAERRERAARDQQLFPDFDDLDELRRIGVEVDHVAGFLARPACRCSSPRRRRPGRARARRWCRRRSSRPDGPPLVPRGCASSLSSGVAWARKSSTPASAAMAAAVSWIVAGDHHGADAHFAKLGEALLDAAFDDVFQMNHAEHFAAFGDDQRRAAGAGDFVHGSGRPPAGNLPPADST